MIAVFVLLGALPLDAGAPTLAVAAPVEATIRAAPEDDEPQRRRSRDNARPREHTLDMGPAATGLALVAFIAAAFARARRRAKPTR